MNHAIEAGKGRTTASTAMGIKFLFCEDVAALLSKFCMIRYSSIVWFQDVIGENLREARY